MQGPPSHAIPPMGDASTEEITKAESMGARIARKKSSIHWSRKGEGLKGTEEQQSNSLHALSLGGRKWAPEEIPSRALCSEEELKKPTLAGKLKRESERGNMDPSPAKKLGVCTQRRKGKNKKKVRKKEDEYESSFTKEKSKKSITGSRSHSHQHEPKTETQGDYWLTGSSTTFSLNLKEIGKDAWTTEKTN